MDAGVNPPREQGHPQSVDAGSARVAGVIGVGVMGMGMACSLRRTGHEVWACDIDVERRALAGAEGLQLALDAAEVGRQAEAIFIVVVDAAQIDAVLSGASGLLGSLGPGKTVFLCSTISPQDAEQLAARVAATGAEVLDAPISGGPARAHAGSLSMMLAGRRSALRAAEPWVACVSSRSFLISEQPGDATRAKLVNNLLAGVHLTAAAEALALAEKLGLDARQMSELISVSSGQSWMFDDRMPRALDNDFAPRAQTGVLTKDLTLANRMAADLGLSLPLGAQARDMLQATCDGGWRGEDDAAMLKFYRLRFGVKR